MKKLLFTVIAVCMMGLFASCAGVEGKAESFAKQEMEAGENLDLKKMAEIEQEVKEYREGLSEEDQKKFDEALEKAEAKYAKELEEKMKDKLGGALGGLNEAFGDLGSDSEEAEEAEEPEEAEESDGE